MYQKVYSCCQPLGYNEFKKVLWCSSLIIEHSLALKVIKIAVRGSGGKKKKKQGYRYHGVLIISYNKQ